MTMALRCFLFSLLSNLAPSNSLKLPSKLFYHFVAQAPSASGKHISAMTLNLPFSLDFGRAVCPELSSLIVQEKS